MRVFPNVAVLAASSFLLMGLAGAERGAEAQAMLCSSGAREARRPVLHHTVTLLNGDALALWSLRGKVLLIVNTRADCGLEEQMAALESLYRRYREHGLVVIGVPSNDFASGTTLSESELHTFCRRNYGVSFPMLSVLSLKGAAKAPLYRTLTEETHGSLRGEIRADFTKFLVDPKGHVVARFEADVDPLAGELTDAIERTLP